MADNFEEDLSDGIVLAHLVELLAGKDIMRNKRRTKMAPVKLNNVGTVLSFLESQGAQLHVNPAGRHFPNR